MTASFVACGGRALVGDSGPAGNGATFGVGVDTPRPSLAPDSLTVDCKNADGKTCSSPSLLPAKGEDGEVRIRVPKYTVHSGTLTDSVTQLTWQIGIAPGHPTWKQAVAYCDSLVVDGESDFRLPTRLELETLFDFGISWFDDQFPPALQEPTPGASFPASCLWTRTARQGAGERWKLCPLDDEIWYDDEGSIGSVRCVRGPVTTQHFVLSGDKRMALDESTGLIWWRKPVDAVASWKSAVDSCESASFDGLHDWRLPSVKELASLADLSQGERAIDANVFPDVRDGPYWSSTYVRDGVDDAWAVTFSDVSDPSGGSVAPAAWASFLPESQLPYLCVRH